MLVGRDGEACLFRFFQLLCAAFLPPGQGAGPSEIDTGTQRRRDDQAQHLQRDMGSCLTLRKNWKHGHGRGVESREFTKGGRRKIRGPRKKGGVPKWVACGGGLDSRFISQLVGSHPSESESALPHLGD